MIALVEQLLGLATVYLGTNIGLAASRNHLREDVVADRLTLDRDFHKTHAPGELLERIDGDINVLGQSLFRNWHSICSTICCC